MCLKAKLTSQHQSMKCKQVRDDLLHKEYEDKDIKNHGWYDTLVRSDAYNLTNKI